nr:metallophosphoesterase [Lachnospiraceae bacterium]
MHYAIADIHNDRIRLEKMLKKIGFSDEDRLYVIGDVFDRCEQDADPVGVYNTLLGLGERCSFVRGNHDEWLARYIKEYFKAPKRRRSSIRPYPYNSFKLMEERIPPMDMLKIADNVKRW